MTQEDLTYGMDNEMYWAGNILKISGENKRINDFWRQKEVKLYIDANGGYEIKYTGNRGTYLDKMLFTYFCDWLSYEAARLCKEYVGAEYMSEARSCFRKLKSLKGGYFANAK